MSQDILTIFFKMNSIILCFFVLCTAQIIPQPTNAQQDILNEYEPIFKKLNGMFGTVANSVGNTRYYYRTQLEKAYGEFLQKTRSISTETITKINENIESLTTFCRDDSRKQECLKLKELDVGNFTIRTDAGFDICRQIFSNASNVGSEVLDNITYEISRINGLLQTAKSFCTETISSDEKIRVCLFENLYFKVLPPLNIIKDADLNIQEAFDAAKVVVDDCYNAAVDVIVNYYAEQVTNNFKYCCIYGN